MTAEDEDKKKQLEEARKRYAKLKNKKGKQKSSTTAPEETDTPDSQPISDAPGTEAANSDPIEETKDSSYVEIGAQLSPDAQVTGMGDLEKDNEELRGRLLSLENEVSFLQETNSEIDALKKTASKVDGLQEDIDRLTSELEASKRQNTQLQAAASRRRTSSIALAHPPSDVITDLRSQLESKTSIIESLELDRATFSTKLAALEKQVSEKATQVETLEEKAKSEAATSEKQGAEIQDLKKKLAQEQEKVEDEESSRIFAESNAEHLAGQLEAEKQRSEEANTRLNSLERKLGEISASSEPSHDHGSGADSHEIDRLRSRVADLSAQLARFHSGQNLGPKAQVGNLGDEDPFDDVDLSFSQHSQHGQSGQYRGQAEGFLGRSSLADVINSGISVFTSQARAGQIPSQYPPQDQHSHSSAGPSNYQEYLRQEEEAKQALEYRMANRKAALVSWQGWRLDLASTRVAVASDQRLEL